MKVKVKVAQLCLTLYDPMDYTLWNSPGHSLGADNHSLLQVVFPTQGLNQVSCIAGRFFTR